MFKKLTAAMIAACLLSIVSCNKSKVVHQHDNRKPTTLSTITTTTPVLHEDQDFRAMYNNDTLLRHISADMADKYTNLDFDGLNTQLQACTTIDQLRGVYTTYGISEGNRIVDLAVENFGYLQSIKQKYPSLANMSQSELQQYWLDQWNKVMVWQNIVSCSQQYAQDVRDCNDDYAAAVAVAAVGALFAGPGAVAALAVGIAGAVITHYNCLERAKREYSNCK
ncbi:hypothetical protein D3C72_1091430 [compost metagenome]